MGRIRAVFRRLRVPRIGESNDSGPLRSDSMQNSTMPPGYVKSYDEGRPKH
jgi:hypothetical protein